MCICVNVWVYMQSVYEGQKWVLDSLYLKLQQLTHLTGSRNWTHVLLKSSICTLLIIHISYIGMFLQDYSIYLLLLGLWVSDLDIIFRSENSAVIPKIFV